MSIDSALQALARTLHEGGSARALPAACYSDPAFFDLECERVLRPGWHAVARWDELSVPGAYRAVDLFGERVLVVRDESGRLRAYSGICLHRAFPLVAGDGHAKRFVCPYHRWAYDLDGRLCAAPLMDDVAGFDRDALRLAELPIEEWMGFVLVSTNPTVEPLGPRLGALSERLEPEGFAEFLHVGVLEWSSPWNWKVMIENFIESYHHLGPHVDNLGRTNPAKGTHAVDVEGPCLLLENPAVDGAHPFWVFQVFPTLLCALPRGPFPLGSWYEMQIDRHDHFHLRVHILLPEALAQDANAVALATQTLTEIHLQDIPMCEGIQAGLQSRLWTPGPLSVQEATLPRFHHFLAEALTPAPHPRGA